MAIVNWGFCDLSIHKNLELKPSNLKLIEKLGYTTVAINTHIEEANEEPKKKKKKSESKDKPDPFPLPVTINEDVMENSKLKFLQRITIEFSESSISHKITQSENIKKYNLIAVIPKTLAAFQYACGTMDIDIISFEPGVRMPFKVSRKLYRQAVDRGIFFELSYSPAIIDSGSRKNIISTSHSYHAVGKSKNILVTSGAENVMHIRGVYDVINLGFLFGLNSNQSLECVRDNPRKVILKSEGRQSGKLYVNVERDTENKSKENKT